MPVFVIVLLSIAAFFALLLILPVRAVLTYQEKVTLRILVLGIPVWHLPRRKKPPNPRDYTAKKIKHREEKAAKKATKKAAKAAKKLAKKEKHAAEHKQTPRTLLEDLRLVRALVGALLRATDKHLSLRTARLTVRVVGEDAAATALLYGAVSASLSYLFSALDRITRLSFSKRVVGAVADYTASKPSADVKLVFSIAPWRAFALLFSVALAFVKAKRGAKRRHQQQKTATSVATKG